MPTLFPTGQLVTTPGALETFSYEEMIDCLNRHKKGDWGNVSESDRKANNRALKDGDRILSSYILGKRTLWILTEADRSVTTLLLPSDY